MQDVDESSGTERTCSMTADFDTIRETLVRISPIPDGSVNERAEEALAALSRVQTASEQTEKALAQIAEGPTWRSVNVSGTHTFGAAQQCIPSFIPADVARAALKLLRGKATR